MDTTTLYTAIVITVLLLISISLVSLILRNPYHYPYYTIDIDISGRKNVRITEEIEQYILDNGFSEFKSHADFVEQWKTRTSQKAHASIFRFLRSRQYDKIIDDDHMFIFNLRRNQTRYKQQNYIKTSYTISAISDSYFCSYIYLSDRYNALKQIGFETTTAKYAVKNQRKLLTPELRKRIKLRDNYTCKKCGKYMPDEIGLHIDHIIPISKGGKTVKSNLQVLCSKCNGRKSNKL